jgi:hypothetical protein
LEGCLSIKIFWFLLIMVSALFRQKTA